MSESGGLLSCCGLGIAEATSTVRLVPGYGQAYAADLP